MLLIYYGAVLLVFIAIALLVYILTVSGWCANRRQRLRRRHLQPQQTPGGRFGDKSFGEMVLLPYVYSSFTYNKGVDDQAEAIADCVVCLNGYEEGEEARQLPRCKHYFHADCIDMWLYSHSDCPVCRSPVDRQLSRQLSYQHMLSFSPEYDHSYEAMLRIHMSS